MCWLMWRTKELCVLWWRESRKSLFVVPFGECAWSLPVVFRLTARTLNLVHNTVSLGLTYLTISSMFSWKLESLPGKGCIGDMMKWVEMSESNIDSIVYRMTCSGCDAVYTIGKTACNLQKSMNMNNTMTTTTKHTTPYFCTQINTFPRQELATW